MRRVEVKVPRAAELPRVAAQSRVLRSSRPHTRLAIASCTEARTTPNHATTQPRNHAHRTRPHVDGHSNGRPARAHGGVGAHDGRLRKRRAHGAAVPAGAHRGEGQGRDGAQGAGPGAGLGAHLGAAVAGERR
jgi:hypothetical protein